MSDTTEKAEKTVSLDQILAALPEAVHFSAKTTNSNAEGAGVRLSQNSALDVPYVCARALLNEGRSIPLDYLKNSGPVATIFKALKTAIVLPEKPTEAELANAPKIAQLLEQHPPEAATMGGEAVDIRSRQILIPRPDGSYVSITPLTSAGLCHYVNQAVDVINEAVKASKKTTVPKTRKAKSAGAVQADWLEELATAEPAPLAATTHHRLTTAQMGIGGSNPQNVGSWVREMQRPIYCMSPNSNRDLREALRVFYQGFTWHLDAAIIQRYRETFARLFSSTDEADDLQMAHTLRDRRKEKFYIRQLVRLALLNGEQWYERLQEVQEFLPSKQEQPRESFWIMDGGHAGTLTLVERGMIDPALRTEAWKTAFANRLTHELTQHKTKENNQMIESLPLDDRAKGKLKRLILGVL